MDVGLPGRSGLEALEDVVKLAPDCRVVILTVFEDEKKISAAISAGASGYLLKTARPEQIVEAIHEAARGGSPMSPLIAASVVKLLAKLTKPSHPGLALAAGAGDVVTDRGRANSQGDRGPAGSEHSHHRHAHPAPFQETRCEVEGRRRRPRPAREDGVSSHDRAVMAARLVSSGDRRSPPHPRCGRTCWS